MRSWAVYSLCISLLWLVGFMLFNQPVRAESPDSPTLLAAIVLNLARYTDWPEHKLPINAKEIALCVLGNNVIQDAFSQIEQKQVGQRKLMVVHLPRVKNINACHLLFISELDRGTIIQLLTEAKSKTVMTINAEESHFLEDGGMVFLRQEDDKMNIEINLSTVNKEKINISSRLLQLARILNL